MGADQRALDINLLLTFQVLLEEQSVSRSAARLGITQAAVSSQLARLRKHYDNPLFVSSGRGMKPTAFANELAEPVQTLVENARQIMSIRSGFDRKTTQRRFRIQAGEIETLVLLAAVNRTLLREAPGIQTLTSVSSPTLKHTDLAIVPIEMQVDDMRKTPLYQDSHVGLVCKDNPLFGDTISEQQYFDATHILRRNPRNGAPDQMTAWFKREGFRRREGPIVEAISSVPFVLCGSPYITTVLASFAAEMVRYFPLRIVELPFDMPTQNFLLQWYASLEEDPAGEWLRDLIIETAAKIYGPISNEQLGRTFLS